MTDIAALGLRVDGVDGIDQAKASLDRLVKAAESMERSAEKMAGGSKKAAKDIQEIGKSSDNAGKSVGSLAGIAQHAGGVLAGAFSIVAIKNYADSWSDMQSRVGAATKDMDGAAKQMTRLVEIANASYSPLSQTVEAYAGNVSTLQELGKSATEAADFTESLNHMLVLTATKGERAASVQTALAKAMDVGKLGAEGLETVLANGGEVAAALAKELGTTVSGLRAMASEGKITSQVIADGIIKPLDEVRVRAAEMPATIADSFTRVSTNTTELVGRFDKLTGASEAVAGSILKFADGLRELAKNEDTLKELAKAGGVLVDVGTVLAVVLGARLAGAATVSALAFTKANIEAVRYQVTLARMAGVSAVASAGMAALGGPVGLAIAGLGLAYWAWEKYGKSARDNADAGVLGLVDAKSGVDDLVAGFEKLNKLQREQAISIKNEELAEATKKATEAVEDLSNAYKPFTGKGMNAVKKFNQEFSAEITALAGNTNLSADEMASAFSDLIDKYISSGRAYESQRGQMVEYALKAVDAASKVNQLTAEIKALTGAQRENAALSSGSGDPYNDGTQYDTYTAQLKKTVAAAIEGTKSFKSLAERTGEVRAQGDLAKAALEALKEAGKGGSKEADTLRSRIKGVNEELTKMGKSGRIGSSGVKQAENAYATLSKRIEEYVAQLELEAKAGEKASTSQKMQIELDTLLEKSKGKVSAATIARIRVNIEEAASLEEKAAAEQQAIKIAIALNDERIAADEELARGMADLDNRVNATRLAMHDYEQSIKDTVEMTNLEVSTLGMNSVARQTLIEQLRIEHEWRDKIQKIKDEPWKTDEERQTAIAKAEAMKLKLKANAQTKAYISEWEKAYDQTSQALTDALMRGGQDAGEYLKDYFRTLVLRPVIQTVMAPVAGAVTNLMQGGGIGSGGMGGALNTGMNAYKAFSNSQMFSDFGTYAGMNINGVGTKMFEMGMESAGESLMDFGVSVAEYADVINAAGDVLGYGKALYDLSQGKYGSAVGTAVGTYFGGPIGAAIGSAIGGWIDSSTASRGANHSGAAFSTSMAGNNAAAGQIFGSTQGDWYGDVTKRYSAGVEAKLAVSVSAMAGVYNSLTNYAGETSRKIDLLGAFVANGVHQDEDAYGYGQVRDKLSGEILGAFTNRELGTDTDAAFKAYMGQMGGLIVEQLKASDIPGWMKQQLNTIEGEVTIEGLQAALNQIAAIDTGFKVLGQTMGMFNGMSAETQTALLNISGGMEGLNTNAGAYYQGFYDETERMEILSGNLRKALGGLDLSIDPAMGNDAKEQYRKAVEDAFAVGNGQAAASLLALSGNFATAADYAQKAAEESSKAIIEAAQAAADAQQEAALAAAELAASLRSGLIGLESRFADGGLSQQYRSDDAASALQSLFAGIGISKSADGLSKIILGATPAEIENNFRAMWGMFDSDEARQKLVDVTGAMLDIADASKTAADAVEEVTNALYDQIKAYREGSLASAIESALLGTMDGQGRVDYLAGKEQGLWGQLGATDDPVGVAQQLQQVILDRIKEEAELRFAVDESVLSSLQSQLSVAESLKSAMESMQSARDSLALGSSSALNPYTQMQYAGSKFDEAYAKALTGDSSAWKDVQSFGQNYVQLGRDNYASSGGAADIYFRVTEAMDELIGMGMGAASEIELLQSQIELQQRVADSSEQTLWTNQQSYEALNRLDAAMAGKQDAALKLATESNALLKEQLAETREQNAILKAQIEQQAAIANAQKVRDEKQIAEAAKSASAAEMALAK